MNVDLLQYLLGVMTPKIPELDDSSLTDVESILQGCLGEVWVEQAKRASLEEDVSNG